MHRTQISLDEKQYRSLRSLAEREGRSLAYLVRQAIDAFLGERNRGRGSKLDGIAGIGEDRTAAGAEHDRLLYGDRE